VPIKKWEDYSIKLHEVRYIVQRIKIIGKI